MRALAVIEPRTGERLCLVGDADNEGRERTKDVLALAAFRPGTDDGDYQVKLHKLIAFLEEGDKTKVTLRFRGREMAHQEFGLRILERVKADLDAYGVVEQFPKLEGRQMVMVLAPKKKVTTAKPKKETVKQAAPAPKQAAKPAAA